ncbi:MAG: hypothetical protein H7Y02_02240 [Candidatus Obscuribacterales bacterium]|nr:hypothetical protein [Steroidobacteraceae bacterium]
MTKVALAVSVSCVSMLLTACGGGGGGDSPSAPASSPPTVAANSRPIVQTDLEIVTALYSDNARTPNNFYSETVAPSMGYVSTVHVKSGDVFSNNALPQYELCSDDWNQAYGWAEQAAQSAPQTGLLLETNTSTRFYEFVRERTGQPAGVTRARVYRCAYLDRGTVDLRTVNNRAGLLNQRPITSTVLQELSEYLWRFTQYNNYGNSVLKSTPVVNSGNLQHDLVIASLTPRGAANGCDRIDVYTWLHTVDPQTGELTLTATTLWNFAAKRVGYWAELCGTSTF